MREKKKTSRSASLATATQGRNPFAARHHGSSTEPCESRVPSGIGCACHHGILLLQNCAARHPTQLPACFRGSRNRGCIDLPNVGGGTSCRQSGAHAASPRAVARHRSGCCAGHGRVRVYRAELGISRPLPRPLSQRERGESVLRKREETEVRESNGYRRFRRSFSGGPLLPARRRVEYAQSAGTRAVRQELPPFAVALLRRRHRSGRTHSDGAPPTKHPPDYVRSSCSNLRTGPRPDPGGVHGVLQLFRPVLGHRHALPAT